MSQDYDRRGTPGDESASAGQSEKLMEAGSIHLDGEECHECRVSRSMPVISADGEQVGWVAAVSLADGGESAGVLLAHPQTTLQYYLLPPSLIARVADGRVLLRVSARAAEALPRRQMT